MTAGLLAPPGYQWKDNNGNPLAAGYVYTYAEGTTNNLSTYRDFEGTKRHPNPVRLDADGRRDIWLSTAHRYKIVIKDNLGNTIVTTDSVTGTSSAQSGGITLLGALDTNGYLITSNSNKNIIINPHGTGSTNIEDFTCEEPLNLNGKHIVVTDNTGFIETSTSNEILMVDAPASSVNYAQTTASTTTTPVLIAAKGSDTNVSLNLVPKGTGVVNIPGNSSNGTIVKLYEQTTNGANYIEVKAPSSVSSNCTFTLPSTDGANTNLLQTTGSKAFQWYSTEGTGWRFLGTVSVSSEPNIFFTDLMNSNYSAYKIIMYGTSASGASVHLQLSTDAGTSWVSSGMYGAMSSNGYLTYIQYSNTSFVRICPDGGSTLYLNPLVLDIQGTNNPSAVTTYTAVCATGQHPLRTMSAGYYNSTAEVNGLRLNASYMTGTAYVYGYQD